MALTFDQAKTNIPGVGERVYLFSQYKAAGGQCLPNQLNTGRACIYFFGLNSGQDEWAVGFRSQTTGSRC